MRKFVESALNGEPYIRVRTKVQVVVYGAFWAVMATVSVLYLLRVL